MHTSTAIILATGAAIALAAAQHTPAPTTAPLEAQPTPAHELSAAQTERTLKTARRIEKRLARAAEMIEEHKHGRECKENPHPVAPLSLSR